MMLPIAIARQSLFGSGWLVFSVIGTFMLVILLKIPIELFAPKLPQEDLK